MSLFKKKNGSNPTAPKGKRKRRPANKARPSSNDINNPLPDGAVPPSASVSLDDLQKAKPTAKRKPRAKKRKARPSAGNKPSFLDKLGLGKKKKKPSSLPATNVEGQAKPARPKKKPKTKVSFLDKIGLGKKKKPQPSNLSATESTEGHRKKKPKTKSKGGFLEKIGLAKKQKKQPSQAPVIPKPERNPVITSNGKPVENPASASLPTFDNIPTSSVEEVLKAKPKGNRKGKKKKVRSAGNKNKKSLKLIVGLVFGIIGLALAVLLLLPLLSDAENGNLKGTVTGGNVENQQPAENKATEETAENNQNAESATPPPAPANNNNQAKPVEANTAQAQKPVNNKPVAQTTNQPQRKSGEHMMNSKPNNGHQKITVTDKDFLELSDTMIYRDE